MNTVKRKFKIFFLPIIPEYDLSMPIMKSRIPKRPHEKVVRTTISLPPMLFMLALDQQRIGSYTSFSNYVQDLIREREKSRLPRIEV